MPDVSIIIPLHQGAATIAETLESCTRERQGLDVEVIVVDDRSSDGGPTIAEAHRARPLMLRAPRPGPSAARNAGLARASGATVIFCDADDVFAANAIPVRLARLEREPKNTFLVSSFELLWPNGRRTRPRVPALGDDALRALVRLNQGPPVSWTFPRSLLGDAPFRDDLLFFEDWALVLDVAFDSARLVHHATVDCTYRQRRDMAMMRTSASVDRTD